MGIQFDAAISGAVKNSLDGEEQRPLGRLSGGCAARGTRQAGLGLVRFYCQRAPRTETHRAAL
jgi:hypothetical protein